MSSIKRIGILFPGAAPHYARVLHGIVEYGIRHSDWTFIFDRAMPARSMRNLKDWSGDGVIALARTPAEIKTLKELSCPAVNLAGDLENAGLPRVTVDHAAIGRMAAEHLLSCGFRRFAYYSMRNNWYSKQREYGFRNRLEREGYACSVLEGPKDIHLPREKNGWLESLERWLQTLEIPTGLMAVTDFRAILVIEACQRLKLRIPHDLAVIGVDNEEVTCMFSHPPLSSIARNAEKVGYKAAELLEKLMSGEDPPQKDIVVPPECVVKRASTDVMAVEDVHVASALQFMREHINEPFGVEAILANISVSRSYLERSFKRHLGCTPHEFISRIRVEKAKELLTLPEKMTLDKIATACGFSETRRLRIVFQRVTGETPARYRSSNKRQTSSGMLARAVIVDPKLKPRSRRSN